MSNRRVHVKFISAFIIAFVFMSIYVSKANAAESYVGGGGTVDSWFVRNYGISIGKLSETNGDYGISFGYDTLAEGNYSTAIGYQSKAGQRIDSNRTPQYSTAIGYKAVASEGNSVALGSEVNATKGGVSIGTLATAAQNGIAIGFGGSGSKTQAEYYGIAIGAGAQTTKNYATAIGNSAKSNALYALALGDSSTAFGENSVALGNYSATQESESYTVSVGFIINLTTKYIIYIIIAKNARITSFFLCSFTICTNLLLLFFLAVFSTIFLQNNLYIILYII